MAVLAALLPLISTIAQIGTSIYSATESNKQAKKSRNAVAQAEASNRAYWEQHAYKDPAAIEASRKEGAANIETSRASAMERLTQALGPSRGWGRGSGVLGAVGKGLESESLRAKGELNTSLTKEALTPMWGYQPLGELAGGVSQQGAGYGGMAQDVSKSFSTASGYINTLYGNK